MDEVIKFFKHMNLYNKQLFDDLIEQSLVIDKPYEEISFLVGCYKEQDKIRLVLPKIYSVHDILIYIHEFTHAITNDESEEYANLMEANYINEFIKDKKIKLEIIEKTKEQIKRSNSDIHTKAKELKISSIKI